MTGWLFLVSAIILEIGGTLSLKLSEGFTRVLPTVGIVVFYLGSFACLIMALKSFHLGFVYAVWSGIGITVVAIASHFLFAEPMPPMKILSLALIIAGVVGLNLSGGHG